MKTISSVLSAALVAASMMQAAAAGGEHRHGRYADRAPVSASQQHQVAVPSVQELNYEYWRDHGSAAGGPAVLRPRGD